MTRTTLLSILAGLTFGGCGSSALSVSQLRTTATAICNVAVRRADKIPTPSTPAGSVVFIRRGIDAFSPELKGLQTLQASRPSSRAYSTTLGAIAAELSAMRSALKALNAGGDPLNTTKRLQQRLAPLEARANAAWERLEIPACQSR